MTRCFVPASCQQGASGPHIAVVGNGTARSAIGRDFPGCEGVERAREVLGSRLDGPASGRSQIRDQLVVTQGARLALLGIAIGVPASLAMARVLGSLLYGVAPSDAKTHAVAALAVFALALVASWLPAWRASHIDPMIALRAE